MLLDSVSSEEELLMLRTTIFYSIGISKILPKTFF